jgi:hypothetical protein
MLYIGIYSDFLKPLIQSLTKKPLTLFTNRLVNIVYIKNAVIIELINDIDVVYVGTLSL